jgi:hypothetical protein
MLFDEYAFDIATRDEEETFHPVDFDLLNSGDVLRENLYLPVFWLSKS